MAAGQSCAGGCGRDSDPPRERGAGDRREDGDPLRDGGGRGQDRRAMDVALWRARAQISRQRVHARGAKNVSKLAKNS